jgi:hypothetical protein
VTGNESHFRAAVRDLIQRAWIAFAEAARDRAARSSAGGGEKKEAQAAVDWKHAVAVLEADD